MVFSSDVGVSGSDSSPAGAAVDEPQEGRLDGARLDCGPAPLADAVRLVDSPDTHSSGHVDLDRHVLEGGPGVGDAVPAVPDDEPCWAVGHHGEDLARGGVAVIPDVGGLLPL